MKQTLFFHMIAPTLGCMKLRELTESDKSQLRD